MLDFEVIAKEKIDKDGVKRRNYVKMWGEVWLNKISGDDHDNCDKSGWSGKRQKEKDRKMESRQRKAREIMYHPVRGAFCGLCTNRQDLVYKH